MLILKNNPNYFAYFFCRSPSAKAQLDISVVSMPGNDVFADFKGALTEQFVLQELKVCGNLPVFYWVNDSGKAEVDFFYSIKMKLSHWK